MRNTNKLVRGIGVKGMDYPVWSNGKEAKEYTLWSSMLTRCTVGFQKRQPTYKGVGCTDNFKNYSFFYEWCHKQAGFCVSVLAAGIGILIRICWLKAIKYTGKIHVYSSPLLLIMQ